MMARTRVGIFANASKNANGFVTLRTKLVILQGALYAVIKPLTQIIILYRKIEGKHYRNDTPEDHAFIDELMELNRDCSSVLRRLQRLTVLEEKDYGTRRETDDD